jgi:hypothetical protein
MEKHESCFRGKTGYRKLKVKLEAAEGFGDGDDGEFNMPKVGEWVMATFNVKGVLEILKGAIEGGKEAWNSKSNRETSFDELLELYLFLRIVDKLGIKCYPANEKSLIKIPTIVEYHYGV